MSNFSALKTAIQNAIKQNGNEEITGNVLQNILISVVETLGDSAINTLETGLSNEASTRGNADTQLNNLITQLNNLITGVKNNVDNGYVYAGIATPSTTPVSGKVFYIALQAGTYTNFGSQVVLGGITILKYNGSAWSKEQVLYTDGGVFDISAYHVTGGELAKYADLTAALGASGANIPQSIRKGGMSVKFVQTDDNKYVQARCISDEFTTDITQWQGVDEEPIAGSNNLVTSGGVGDKIFDITGEMDFHRLRQSYFNENKAYNGAGQIETNNDFRCSNLYKFVSPVTFPYDGVTELLPASIAWFNTNKVFISRTTDNQPPTGAVYAGLNYRNNVDIFHQNRRTKGLVELKETAFDVKFQSIDNKIESIEEDINDINEVITGQEVVTNFVSSDFTANTAWDAAGNQYENSRYMASIKFVLNGKSLVYAKPPVTINCWNTNNVHLGRVTYGNALPEGTYYVAYTYGSTSEVVGSAVAGINRVLNSSIEERVENLEENIASYNPTDVDLILFLGQSNMAGRGEYISAPIVLSKVGQEFRSVSDPTKLYNIDGIFGSTENDEYINDGSAKTGGLVPSFVNAMFSQTKRKIVGVSASRGGTRISYWSVEGDVSQDYSTRFTNAITWLENNGYNIRHKYCVFCQGESDGDAAMTKDAYKTLLNDFCQYRMNRDLGIEQTFVIAIGKYNGSDNPTTRNSQYDAIRNAQIEYCQSSEYATLVSTMFQGMKDRDLMKDDFHYYQQAYNEVGNEAGLNAGFYTKTV